MREEDRRRNSRALGLLVAATVAGLLGPSPCASQVIPPGQDSLVASMLGGRASRALPDGCALSSGVIDRDRIDARYTCRAGEFALTLHARSADIAASRTTEKFAIELSSPAPPEALVDTLVEQIRSMEGEFRWLVFTPVPPPVPTAAQTTIRPSPAPPPDTSALRERIERTCTNAADAAAAGADPPSNQHGPPAAELRKMLRDIYECLVIADDSPVHCDRIDRSQRRNCRARWMFFHAAKQGGPATNWPAIMAPALHEDCVSADGGVTAPICDQLAAAVLAQDPTRCPTEPAPIRGMCAGIASSDPRQCPDDSADCRELAARLRILAEGGLEKVATSSTPRDRTHARAALGERDACRPVVARFVEDCTAWLMLPGHADPIAGRQP